MATDRQDTDSEPAVSDESAPDEEPDEELGIRVVSAEEMEPASVIADIPDAEETGAE